MVIFQAEEQKKPVLALLMAFNASENQVNTFVTIRFAAVVSGVLFDDPCPPVSDTTIMSSMGAGSDHIDNVKAQLSYALTLASISAVIFLIVDLSVAQEHIGFLLVCRLD